MNKCSIRDDTEALKNAVEKYQTIYVNVKQEDMTEKTAGEVEGFGHGIVSVLKKIGGNIVQFFSIK